MEIMDMILEEMRSRHAYLGDIYTPPYVCSYATHCFNLINREKKIYSEGKRIPDMRMNIMFIAPPGYMKSYYMDNMGADKDSGMFTNCKIHMGVEQGLTEAGLVGTFKTVGDDTIETEGAARTFVDGIMMIDEFSGVTSAMKATYNNQLDSQLLNILDHGRVNKRLGAGKIEYESRMTLWGGIQPARYDFTSGFGRRVWFLEFLPTKKDNDVLVDIKQGMRNIQVDPYAMGVIWEKINMWIDSLQVIKRVEFSDNIHKLYKKLQVNSYDTGLYDRFLLGYHLATYGADETVMVDVPDKSVVEMIKREKKWRDDIVMGIPLVHLERMIAMGGDISTGSYVISRKQLITDSLMFGWNSTQVNDLIAELARGDVVKVKSGMVHMGMCNGKD